MRDYYYESYNAYDIEKIKKHIEIDEYLDMRYGHNANSKSEERWVDKEDEISAEEMEAFQAVQDDPKHQTRILGMQLHDERKALGMSRKYVSKEAGISVDTISRLERGHTNFRKETLDKVRQYLGEES
ncbi:helix-turn-helix domain-containing protein [Oceanobacillus picturae]|uniref:helix-turn-helix domain-containing protein n=1 Tax=Oceanobacillus picturae TaxID=171693 RepID=UPI000E686560|nr:helix-turn-helix domain-containing protein [Oceanobacillus picturae]RIU93427.1 helix-turn-helix domain-containing protein [Oceanobacillus picturae]